MVWLDNDQPDAVISFLRRAGRDELVTVASLSNRKIKVQVELPGGFESLLADGVKRSTADVKMGFALEPCGYFVGKKP